MVSNEKENTYNVQGYLKANMIVLHSEMYDHDDKDGHSVYIPKLFAINPEQICALEEIKLKLAQNDKDLQEIDKELKHFIITYKIIFEFYDSIKCTLEIIESKEEEGVLPPIIDKIFLKKMLENQRLWLLNMQIRLKQHMI